MAKTLTDFDAVMIAEGVQEPVDEEQYLAAWQHIVDNGMAWKLQGFFGRAAMRMIDEGLLRPAKNGKLTDKPKLADDRQRNADHVDGFDRDDLGESED